MNGLAVGVPGGPLLFGDEYDGSGRGFCSKFNSSGLSVDRAGGAGKSKGLRIVGGRGSMTGALHVGEPRTWKIENIQNQDNGPDNARASNRNQSSYGRRVHGLHVVVSRTG